MVQAELFRFDGCEHVKVDAVAAKGICFAKYDTASTAHLVMEAIHRAECKVLLHHSSTNLSLNAAPVDDTSTDVVQSKQPVHCC